MPSSAPHEFSLTWIELEPAQGHPLSSSRKSTELFKDIHSVVFKTMSRFHPLQW